MIATGPTQTPEVALRRTLRDLRQIAEDNAAVDVAAGLAQLDERLRSRRLQVVVVGEHNRGKSSLVNSLIGTPWLPVGQSAPALPPVYVFGGAQEHVEIVYQDGEVAESTRAELLALTAEDAASISCARVAVPSSDLHGLVLIDTPGLNDPDTSRLAQTVFALLPQSDLALLVLDSAQALGASEHDLIERRIAGAGLRRLVVILNRDDELDDQSQRTAVRDRVARMLAPLLGGEPTVLPYAARTALRARERENDRLLARSGYPELRALLEECAAGRAETLRTAVGERAWLLGQALLALLETPLESAEAPVHNAAQAGGTEAAAACRALESIRDAYRLELESFTLALRERLLDETAEATVDDIRRYLPYFIQEAFSGFTREHEQPVREQMHAALRASGLADRPIDALTKPAPAPGLHPYVQPDFLEDSLLLTTFMTLIGLAMRPVVAGAVMTVGPILRSLGRGMVEKETKSALLQAAQAATSDAGLALEHQTVASFAEAIAYVRGAASTPIPAPREPIDDSVRAAARERVRTLVETLSDQQTTRALPT